MNKARRKEIARALALVEEAKSILETCRDEEQDYKDGMPEAIQNGQKGDAADEVVSALEDAISALDDIAQGEIANVAKGCDHG